MSHILTNELELPDELRLKMPELLNFIQNFRSIVVAQGYVTQEAWEKREMKHVTLMLSNFVYNVLVDNA